jgi:hypothetical protein
MAKSPITSSSFVFSVYTPSSFQPAKITKKKKQVTTATPMPQKKRNSSYYNDNPNYHYSILEPQQYYELDMHQDIAKRHGMSRWQLKQMVEV